MKENLLLSLLEGSFYLGISRSRKIKRILFSFPLSFTAIKNGGGRRNSGELHMNVRMRVKPGRWLGETKGD